MASATIDKEGNVCIYEYREDRIDCKCHYDIISIPEYFINPEVLGKLKSSKEPLNLDDLKPIKKIKT